MNEIEKLLLENSSMARCAGKLRIIAFVKKKAQGRRFCRIAGCHHSLPPRLLLVK
jgi:hypothetical protein